MNVNANEMGARLRNLRGGKGWTREATAEKADIAIDTLARLEQGRHLPSLKVALRLATLFGVTVEELALGKESDTRLDEDAAKVVAALMYVPQPQRKTLVDLVVGVKDLLV